MSPLTVIGTSGSPDASPSQSPPKTEAGRMKGMKYYSLQVKLYPTSVLQCTISQAMAKNGSDIILPEIFST